jgi:hypothetical protein
MTGPKLLLVIPPCMFCHDQDAVLEVMTRWACWASLCSDCAGRYGGEGRELRAAPAEPPLPSAEQVADYVGAQAWKRARATLRGRPQAPHEYTLLWRSTDPWQQLRVLSFIRQVGEPRRWGRDTFHYWVHGDYEYWALAPRETILNRRHLSWPSSV